MTNKERFIEIYKTYIKRSGSENIRRSDKVLMSAMADEERMFAF